MQNFKIYFLTINSDEFQSHKTFNDIQEIFTNYAYSKGLSPDVIFHCHEFTSSSIAERIDYIIPMINMTENKTILLVRSWEILLGGGVAISSCLYNLCERGQLDIHLVEDQVVIQSNSDALKDFSARIASCKGFRHYDYPDEDYSLLEQLS